MITVRQVQRLWDSQQYGRLLDDLVSPRIEALATRELAERPRAAAAAMALIRLDELNQGHASICPKLIRAILTQQENDGGWGDVPVTALCLRALLLWGGEGDGVHHGLVYLANLQQPTGLWPKIPIRRMAADPLVSAFVLLQLADSALFRAAVDFDSAVAWFQDHAAMAESSAQTLWSHARPRSTRRETQLTLPIN
jgi:hypothetical protein